MEKSATRILSRDPIQETDSVFTGCTANMRVAHNAAGPSFIRDLRKRKRMKQQHRCRRRFVVLNPGA